jgi:cytochrome c oxidase subunit II
MRRNPLAQMLVFGVIASVILVVLALLVPWFPAQASRQAGNVKTLYDVLLIATVPIFVLVITVVMFSVWKFRMRPGEETKDGPPIHGNTRLEVVWTIVPAALIIAMCTYAYTVLRANEDSKANELTVNVTARQFAFEFSYTRPDGKTVVSSQLYLPDHRPVVFRLRSLDVIHSVFVPNFSEKLDAVPGITTTVRVSPTRMGSYPVECTELCGAGHSLMRATARVVSQQAFTSWLQSQPANAAPPVGSPPALAAQPGIPGSGPAPASTGSTSTTASSGSSGSAALGKSVFLGQGGCGACHTLAAAGATGTVGPDLDTRLRSDCATAKSKSIRGPTLQKCIFTAITNPYAYIPSGYHSGVMPSTFSQSLTSDQIQGLVSFLTSVTK